MGKNQQRHREQIPGVKKTIQGTARNGLDLEVYAHLAY